MMRRTVAGAALAAVAWLLLAGTVGRDSGTADARTGPRTSATPDPMRRANAPAVTGIRLPVTTATDAGPLPLTRAMLERAWHAGELPVELPDGRRYAVALERQQFDPDDQWTIVGRVQTRLGPQAMVLTFGPDAVFGVLPRPDGSLLQITTIRGITRIADAGGLLPPGSQGTLATEPDYLIAPATGSSKHPVPAAAPVIQALAEASPAEIAVLGLYTDDLVQLRGSASAAQTEVTNLFAIANQSHLDSGTGVRMKVVGLRQVTIDPTASNHTALYAVTDNTVAGIDLPSLRDSLAADLVALVRPYQDTHGSCGVAWLLGENRSPQSIPFLDHYGVSVSNVAPCGPYVLAHELGHNMGSAHDRDTQAISGHLQYGAYAYSFGYRQDGPPAFATIMAYAVGQPWLGYFSSPASSACGAACGVADRADNARSLRDTAPVVAAFRGPPGTLTIGESHVFEPQAGSTFPMQFVVRLSGPAPAGGVHFSVAASAGTAQAGVDYLPPDPATRHSIPEGERLAFVLVDIVGDDVEEPDETIGLSLTNVTGATVHDGSAVGRIVNDDPRLTLTGRIRFEEGVPPPTAPFWMTVSGASGNDAIPVELSPPDFTYRLSVVKGANLHFQIDAPPPFAILPFGMNEISSSRVRDIRLKKGLLVSGQVTVPAGQPALTTPLGIDFRASIDGVYQSLPYTTLDPPDYRYRYWVVPGAWVYLSVTPPAPYQPFRAVNTSVRADLPQNINLSTLPGLVIWGTGRLIDGPPGTNSSLSYVVELSAPAPAGGVRFNYRTVDGSAKAGSDYSALQGSLEIPEGQTVAYTDTINVFGDANFEGDEEFFIVVSNVVGANPVSTTQRVTLAERTPRRSGPSPPEEH